MSHPTLLFHEVTVRYEPEDPPTLATVSFAMEPGERVALVGLNGSGKTTLLAAAVGLVPHEGEIQVAGERLTRQSLAGIRDRIGFLFNVPEDQLLFPRVSDDVAFGLLRRGVPAAEAAVRARRALGALGVEHLADSPVHHLSHGQKQRVALAGALAAEPSLLLLDEPSAGLDPPGKRALAAVLGGLEAAMVIATHDLDFAARLCTRFLMLDQGRIVFDGRDTDEVKRRWGL
jgi:cobalt/nickel transport system ATP-binding protein